MLTLIYKLYRVKLLTLRGLLVLSAALWKNGVNLMALLSFAAKLYPNQTAIVADGERLGYDELWQQTERLASALYQEYGVRSQQRVALVYRNHVMAIRAILACSRLGAHLYLLNPEMSASQLWALEERYHFDLFIYDQQIAHYFETAPLQKKSLPAYHPVAPCLARCLANTPRAEFSGTRRLARAKSGNIVVLTGGTTGQMT